MKKALIAGALVFAALYPAAAGAAAFKGTVVSTQQVRHVLVVSSSTGLVRTLHTGSAARVGAFVSVNRSVIAVRSAHRVLAALGGNTPPVGAVANIGVTIGTQGALTQTSIATVGTSSNI